MSSLGIGIWSWADRYCKIVALKIHVTAKLKSCLLQIKDTGTYSVTIAKQVQCSVDGVTGDMGIPMAKMIMRQLTMLLCQPA